MGGQTVGVEGVRVGENNGEKGRATVTEHHKFKKGL